MTLRILLSVQALSLCVLLFGDIGFHAPGRFGLDFAHFVLIAFLYLVVLITGCVRAVKSRKRTFLIAQALLPAIAFLYLIRPLPYYDSSEYQHLVSKPMDEVEAVLNLRGSTRHTSSGNGPARHFITLSGMEITYSGHRVVLSVMPARKR